MAGRPAHHARSAGAGTPVAASWIGFAAMAGRDPDCIFCKILAGEVPGTIVAEDERTVSFMDVNPGSRGHALVVPRRHVADLGDIDDEDLAAVAAAARRLARRARERLGADGGDTMNSWGPAGRPTGFPFPPPRHP